MAAQIVTEEIEQPVDTVVESTAVEGDADDRAMAEAEAELAAENAANAGEGDGEKVVEGDAEVVVDPPVVAAEPVVRTTPIMIPKERLDQESGKRRQAEEELLREQGRRQALEAIVSGTKPAAVVEQPRTPGEQIKDLRASQLGDAKAYNEGDIDIVEFETRRQVAEDKIADIRSQAAVHVATDRATAPANSEWLAAETVKIEQTHPALGYVKPAEMHNLAELAKSEMEEAGAPFNPRSRESILELRQRTAELADHTFGHRIPATAVATVPAKPAAKPAVTAAQRGAKAALAGRIAPDITKVGAAASAAPVTEARIAGMSSTELDELSDAELDAIERRTMAG